RRVAVLQFIEKPVDLFIAQQFAVLSKRMPMVPKRNSVEEEEVRIAQTCTTIKGSVFNRTCRWQRPVSAKALHCQRRLRRETISTGVPDVFRTKDCILGNICYQWLECG